MRLSTHILDTELGEAVGGIKVGLFYGKTLISLQETDEDGRIQNLFEADFRPGARPRSAAGVIASRDADGAL